MSPSRWHLAARLLLLFLMTVNLYRAATQSITTDEAFTFNRSVMTPIPALWKAFDANDHVLHTLLCKVTVNLFGPSEFSLRIPSLLGGALYLWLAYRFALLLAADGLPFLIAVAMLVVNPLMLDYCSIARGYGMATSLFLLSLYHLLRMQEKPVELWRLNVAGICLALAVAANLTVVMPGVALVLVFSSGYLGGPVWERNWERVRARVDYLIERMLIPGVVLVVAILLIPLLPAKREAFYVGATSLRDSAVSMVYASLWRPGNLLEHTVLHGPVENVAIWLGLLIVPVILAGQLWWRPRRTNLAAVTIAVTLGLQVVAHAVNQVPYPERRTGLYYFPLVTFVALGLLSRLPKRVGVYLCIPVLAQFLFAWNVKYYDEWLFDAGNRDLMRYVQAHRPPDGKPLRLSASWQLLQSVVYYRQVLHLPWLEVPTPSEKPKPGYDVYLLLDEDLPLVQQYGLQIRHEHPFSKVVVATR